MPIPSLPVVKISALVGNKGPVLVRIESDTGHGGSSGTSPVSKKIDEWADKFAFAAHFLPAGTLDLPPQAPMPAH